MIAEARKRFEAYLTKNESIPADIRGLVYKLVVQSGDEKDYEELLKIYRTADLHEEKLRALRALGYSRQPALTLRTLQWALDSGEVREQDLFYATATCSTHKDGRELVWQFMKENWAKFHEKLGETAMLIDRVVQYATKDFASEEKAKDIEQFFKAHPVPSADRTIKQSIETVLSSAKWVNSNRDAVAKWLAAQ